MTRAYIGIGANLGNASGTVAAAMNALDTLPGTRLVVRSHLYRTAPQGYTDQPPFVNAVAAIETTLEPEDLLEALLALEQRFGRTRSFANAPRTLDLDLLLYGERTLATPTLIVPHPRMHERAFVLVPLAEIAPDLVIAGQGMDELLPRVHDQEVAPLES